MGNLKGLKLFELGIHLLHINWIFILWTSLSENAELNTNPTLIISWTLAFLAEIIRWEMVGKEYFHVSGAYSYGRAIEITLDKFFLLSWYLGPPNPPSNFIHQASETLYKKTMNMQLRMVFSNYFLTKIHVAFGVFAACMFFFAILDGKPPTLGGINRSYHISILYWYVCFSIMGRMIFIIIYSFFVRIFGVK